jgi:Flp pilus assembly protein TadB
VTFKNVERFGGGRLAPTWKWAALFSLVWSAGAVLFYVVSGSLEFTLTFIASGVLAIVALTAWLRRWAKKGR